MKIIDLTHTIAPGMPVYPGTEPPVLHKANTIERDHFREMKITMYSHTGTHMDAPAHMLADGVYLDELDAAHFVGKAIVLDVEGGDQPEIGLTELICQEERISGAEFVLLKTGWSRYWGTPRYFEPFPYLTGEAAAWLAGFPLKGIGIDAISIDDMNTHTFPVHKTLLTRNIVIIENLTNLDAVGREDFLLSVLPLKTREADGSPVRAVCMLLQEDEERSSRVI